MLGLKRGGKKEEGKKKGEKEKEKKKNLSSESNLGPLTLRCNGRYAYNSEGVTDRYSKRAWGEPWCSRACLCHHHTDAHALQRI